MVFAKFGRNVLNEIIEWKDMLAEPASALWRSTMTNSFGGFCKVL